MTPALKFPIHLNKARMVPKLPVDVVNEQVDLFKKMLMDDSFNSKDKYEYFSHATVGYFERLEDRTLSFSISGKWKGELVNLDFSLVEGMPKMVMLNINGKEIMTTLHKHPLWESYPFDKEVK